MYLGQVTFIMDFFKSIFNIAGGTLPLWQVVGGLGLFLLGMKIMSEGIYKSAGEGFHSLLTSITSNRFFCIFTGLTITTIIQSSSATTVMLVSLVNANLVTLRQAIGVIMGANIGTTFTAWIITLLGFKVNIASFALPAIALSVPMHFSKKEKVKELSNVFLGFGILFLGLDAMKNAVSGIQDSTEVFSFVANMANYGYFSVFLFIILGALLTITVQSSSAAMTITLTFAFNGWIPYEMAAAIVLGENIGTTITAYLASLEMSNNAKRTARAHMFFNIIGVLWILPLFYPVLGLIDRVMIGEVTNPHALPLHLSVFHTFFNVANTLLLVGFIPQIEKMVLKLIKVKSDEYEGDYRIPFIHMNIPERIEVNLINARYEIGKMANTTRDMLMKVLDASNADKDQLDIIYEEVSEKEEFTDQMQEQLTSFLTECSSETLSENQATEVNSQIRIVNELESIADACFKIVQLLARKHKKSMSFHENAEDEITNFSYKVMDFLKYNADFLTGVLSDPDIKFAHSMEESINKHRKMLKKMARKHLKKGANIKGELLFLEIVQQLEHIGDFCLNISDSSDLIN